MKQAGLAKKDMIRRTKKRPLWCCTVIFAISVAEVHSQSFDRQAPCPNEPELLGYSNIPDLNDDMADEFARIEQGGNPPGGGYTLALCPGEVFDVTGGNTVRPVIDEVTITCGGPASIDPVCILDGNREQVVVEDSRLADYPITSVTMQGITFSESTRGVSISLTASEPAVFSCIDCIWQDYDDNTFVIDLRSSMTMKLQNAIFRSTDGNPETANVNQAMINNSGGKVEIDGITVEATTATRDMFVVSDGGTLLVKNGNFAGNLIRRNLSRTTSGGTATFENVEVRESVRLNTVFFARDPGVSLTLTNTTITENRIQDREWIGVTVGTGATSVIKNAEFSSNENLLLGVTAQGNSGGTGTIDIQRSDFRNNVAPTSPSTASALVGTLGSGESDPFIDLLGIDFEGNQEFTANILTLGGGKLNVEQTCFLGNSNTLVVFLGAGGQDFSQRFNFISDNEVSAGCPTGVDRIGVESRSSEGCFVDVGSQCQVDCGGPLADSDICLSDADLSEAPSGMPSEMPTGTPTISPSNAPTIDESAAPSQNPTISAQPTFSNQTDVPSMMPSEEPSRAPFPGMPNTPRPTLEDPIIRPVPTERVTSRPTKPPSDCGDGKGKGGKGACSRKKSYSSKSGKGGYYKLEVGSVGTDRRRQPPAEYEQLLEAEDTTRTAQKPDIESWNAIGGVRGVYKGYKENEKGNDGFRAPRVLLDSIDQRKRHAQREMRRKKSIVDGSRDVVIDAETGNIAESVTHNVYDEIFRIH